MSDPALPDGAIITLEDAQRGITTPAGAERALQVIALCESAETLAMRAKDAAMLEKAVRTKLLNQAAYAVWRQDVVVPSQRKGGPGRGKRTTERSPVSPFDPGDKAIERWRLRLCRKVATNKWLQDDTKLGAAVTDITRRAVRICEQENDGTVRGTEGTGEFERYTPARYIELAREVLGGIDLDPATSEYAQETVGATQYFTAEHDGLTRNWPGRVWLDPPYHRELAPLFVRKLVAELTAGRCTAAIMLTNNSTDTEWFQSASQICNAICFTDHRIAFEVPGSDPVSPTQGQAFFYFGTDIDIFVDVFKAAGWCVRPV